MAMLKPAWMQANTGDTAIEYTAQDDRRLLRAIFSREGVRDKLGGDLKVSQRGAGANFSVDVAAGECAIYGDDVSDQGAYQCASTAIENRAVFSDGAAITAPATGSRVHRVVARIKDKKHNGLWTVYDWAIEILQDTGTGTPAIPNSAIGLGRITIAAGQASITNANITDDRGPSSVGTPAIQGNFGALYAGFSANDATRPLRWQVNPDGWVMLSGFVRWIEPNTTVAALEQRTMGGTPLNDSLVKPAGFRDFPGTSSHGPTHYAVDGSGTVYFRFQNQITLTQNVSWFSFDGCFYRL